MQLSAMQQARQTIAQQFYNLEKQFREEERRRDPYQRLLMQSETLDEMKDLKEKMRQDLAVTTPMPHRNRTQALFPSITPFLKFNARGENYNGHGKLISQSRDLIQHAVRDQQRFYTPRERLSSCSFFAIITS